MAPDTAADLVIDDKAAKTGAAIASWLAGTFGTGTFSVAGKPLEELIPGVAPLVDGCEIRADPEGTPPEKPPQPPHLLFVVESGPDAGKVIPLQRGTYIIGRCTAEDVDSMEYPDSLINLSDPALSRCHAEVEVGMDAVVLRDRGSSNGTWVEGRRVNMARLHAGDKMRLGSGVCRLTYSARVPLFSPVQAVSDPLQVPVESDQRSGLVVAGSFLPLLLGIVLALTTGMWMFLAFSGLSAVTALLAATASRRKRRRRNAAIAEAVCRDAARRSACAPAPGTVALGIRSGPVDTRSAVSSSLAPPGIVHGTGMPCLRVGTADQPANIETVPRLSGFTPPVIPNAPVLLDLAQVTDTYVHGSHKEVAALARILLLQLGAALSTRPGLACLCVGQTQELELAARYLPRTRLVAIPYTPAGSTAGPPEALLASAIERAMESSNSRGSAGAVRQDFTGPDFLRGAAGPAPDTVICLFGRWAGHHPGLRQALNHLVPGQPPVISFCPATLPAHDAKDSPMASPGMGSIVLSPGLATWSVEGETLRFCADLMAEETFDRCSRGPWPSREVLPGKILPAAAAFGSVLPTTASDIRKRWLWAAGTGKTFIGMGTDGILELDPETDGPHFLVAGTTGSGKSEFLRSLLLGLAVTRPPTSMNFLLIDFKGGSGLGPLRVLPHTVGFLTDLGAEHVERMLTGLRAELQRRESLLAAAGTEDLQRFNARQPLSAQLPMLMVVVDEFRMLADEVPGALAELLRIAAVGRSLGIGLVLATQRPQGAVTADIRANISTIVCLRVATNNDSRDVIGSDIAAGIPASRPGTAYISRSGASPVLFQSLSTGLVPKREGPPVQFLAEYLEDSSSGIRAGSASDAAGLEMDAQNLIRLCTAVGAAAQAAGSVPSRLLLPDPLPQVLLRKDVATRVSSHIAAPEDSLVLGLLDEPERQRQRPLFWVPEKDSHVAVLGTERAGTVDFVTLLVQQHFQHLPRRHLYVLDGDGTLPWSASAQQTGAYVGPDDTQRAARVVDYLAKAALRTLASSHDSGAPRTPCTPQTTLLITGWSRWSIRFRAGRLAWVEDLLADLARDGSRAGTALVLSGDREVVSSRLFPLIPNRFFLPTDASPESLLLWPRVPAMEQVRGRAFVTGPLGSASGLTAQLIQPSPPDPQITSLLPAGCPLPHRVEALPALVDPGDLVNAQTDKLRITPDSIAVGVSGDELETATVRVPPGRVFLVTGPSRSGRSAFLQQVRRAAPDILDCLSPPDITEAANVCRALANRPDGLGEVLLLIDDADSLDAQTHQLLPPLLQRGLRLMVSALSGTQVSVRLPVAAQVRSAPLGAVLQPSSNSDGDILGLRLPSENRLPPGRCFLVDGSSMRETQTAFVPVPGQTGEPT